MDLSQAIILDFRIKKLQKKIRGFIESINSGGCIHFAYYFSAKLKELGIDHKIFLTNYYPIKLTYKDFKGVIHVMVYIKDIGYIDGDNTSWYNCRKNYYRQVKISLRKLKRFSDLDEWCYTYDRSQNPKLKELIDTHITYDNKKSRD